VSSEPLLSRAQIERLISRKRIAEIPPGPRRRGGRGFYGRVCEEISRRTGVLERGEWNHYGCGYASYIDAWFYRTSAEFQVAPPTASEEKYRGLGVLLSRLSPYFVIMEGEKGWWTTPSNSHSKTRNQAAGGGHSYVPQFEMVDRLSSPAVRKLAAQLEPMLTEFGLIRVGKDQLSEPLPDDIRIDTNLSDGPLRLFDALFYWYD
jgi:hypothetical protein